jgi:hypothetical protein
MLPVTYTLPLLAYLSFEVTNKSPFMLVLFFTVTSLEISVLELFIITVLSPTTSSSKFAIGKLV